MSGDTKIEWATKVWNPTRGCSRVSPGCDRCYAMREARRHDHPGGSYEGLTKINTGRTRHPGVDWNGVVRLVPEQLDVPLRWKKPQRIFVNSMSDLFHESLPFEDIAKVMERMCWGFRLSCRKGKACDCACAHDPDSYSPDEDDCRCWSEVTPHTYQILTKRPKRMLEFFAWLNEYEKGDHSNGERHAATLSEHGLPRRVHLGVSVEDQATADERIPLLLRTPAAVRWVSYEPALGPVNFNCVDFGGGYNVNVLFKGRPFGEPERLDWIVVGGESGPGARPFDLAWARAVVAQGRSAGVPVFVKQLGARPAGCLAERDDDEYESDHCDSYEASESRPCPGEPPALGRRCIVHALRDRKGGDPDEWPPDLRVREFPS